MIPLVVKLCVGILSAEPIARSLNENIEIIFCFRFEKKDWQTNSKHDQCWIIRPQTFQKRSIHSFSDNWILLQFNKILLNMQLEKCYLTFLIVLNFSTTLCSTKDFICVIATLFNCINRSV